MLKKYIQTFCEEKIKTDSVFKSCYIAEDIPTCAVHIQNKAESYLQGQSGAIDDETVHRWIVEYFRQNKETLEIKTKPKKLTYKDLNLTFDFWGKT